MELGLKNQVVLVAGSTQGIGKAIAEAFLKEGARVVITGRTQKTLLETLNAFSKIYPNQVLGFRGDLSKNKDIQSCQKLIEKTWGPLDHLILNVGTGRSSSDILSSSEVWNFIYEENLNASYRMIRSFLPQMQKQKWGNIVVIASIAGKEAIGAPIDYSTAKTALIALSKNLSRKVAQDGIRINAVAPGNILFKNGVWDEKIKKNKQKIKQMLDNSVPMKRFGTPEEVASAVVFLSSKQASFITGAVLTVDGGQTTSSLG